MEVLRRLNGSPNASGQAVTAIVIDVGFKDIDHVAVASKPSGSGAFMLIFYAGNALAARLASATRAFALRSCFCSESSRVQRRRELFGI